MSLLKENQLQITEIFRSIQGEGELAGQPTIFIRLTGCNLNCIWCDTTYAREGGETLTISEILRRIKALTIPEEFNVYTLGPIPRWICITGGEPLLQRGGLKELLIGLGFLGFSVSIETNGSLPSPLDFTGLVKSWVVDIKCPSSGNSSSEESIEEWTKYMTRETSKNTYHQFKLVVKDSKDLLFASEILSSLPPNTPITRVISPVIDSSCNIGTPGFLEEVVQFAIYRDCRVSLQLHKIIWGNRKGV